MANNPGYIESLRIGGGFGEPVDGGIDLSANGNIAMDGDLTLRGRIYAGNTGEPLTNAAGEINGQRIQQGTITATQLQPDDDYTVRGLRVTGTLVAEHGIAGHNQLPGVAFENLVFLCHFDSNKPENTSVVGDVYLDWTGQREDLQVLWQGTACAGKFGKGIAFSGVNGYARSAGTSIAQRYGGGPITFSLWCKTGEVTNDIYTMLGFVGPSPNYPNIRVSVQNGTAQVRVRGDDATPTLICCGTKVIADNKWHHVAAVVPAWNTGGTVRLYVDGQLDGSAADTRTATTATSSLLYVGSNSGASQFYKGALDEISIWNRMLSAEEIGSLYMMQQELGFGIAQGVCEGNWLVRSGVVESGVAGAVRGVITAVHGANNNSPGCLKLHAFNGSAWYLFVENDGTLRIHNALPSSPNDGTVVGSQG